MFGTEWVLLCSSGFFRNINPTEQPGHVPGGSEASVYSDFAFVGSEVCRAQAVCEIQETMDVLLLSTYVSLQCAKIAPKWIFYGR